MIVEKERTADVAASAIQTVTNETNYSLLTRLMPVNDDSVTDREQIEADIRHQLSGTDVPRYIRMYLVGKFYELRKNDVKAMGRKRGERGKFMPDKRSKYRETADWVADELRICSTSVKRYYMYAKGIDAVTRMDRDLALSILKKEKRVRTDDIVAIGMSDPGTQKDMIDTAILGRAPEPLPLVSKSKRKRSDLGKIAECVSSLFGEAEGRYSVDALVRDIRLNAEPFINTLSQMILHNADLCRENKSEVIRVITEQIVCKTEEIEEEIRRL